MYKTIIKIRKNLPFNAVNSIQNVAADAFDNRAGKLANISKDPYVLIFEGEEKDYGCLQLGILALDKEKEFMELVTMWDWIDEEPNENCNVLEVLSIPIHM